MPYNANRHEQETLKDRLTATERGEESTAKSRRQDRITRWILIVIGIYTGVIVTLLNIFLFGSGKPIDRAVILMADGLILFWIFLNQSSRLTRALEFGPLVYLGRISYGVYMYQGFLLGVWAAPESTAVWPSYQYTGLIILCIVAPLSYHFFERPILKFKARIGQHDRVRRPV